jgi:addiction module HigA family antidote
MRTLRDRRRQPTHPGAILREDVLPALRMSQTELAERLGVSRVTVNTLLQEKRDLSVELAARIAKLLGHSPESWLRMQEAVDLWRLAQDPARLADVKPLPPERIAA